MKIKGIRIIRGVMGLFFACFITACSNADDENSTELKEASSSLTLSFTKAESSIIGNTQVYLFDGDGTGTKNFRRKINNIEYLESSLKMFVDAGKWNFALVTADSDIERDLISPIRDVSDMSDLKMWETQPLGDALPSIPELRTTYIQDQQVSSGENTVVSDVVPLYRNVSLIKVVISDAKGLDISGTHKLELTDVPTTLNWAGGLYPDKDNPTVSDKPLRGNFNIIESASNLGTQSSDTLSFIIPAHKGTDFLSANPTDVSTHKLKFNIDLACEGGARYVKSEVEIPDVPQSNKILLVKILVSGQLDITTEILSWDDVLFDADLSQTQLFLDKSSVALSYKDTIYVNTNASDYTVEKAPDASWITSVKKVANNGVEIVADVDSYVDNQPRTSYVTIKANNLIKQIAVTQRPDKGTISASDHRLIFCPVGHQSHSLQINSVGGDWLILNTNDTITPATADVQSGPIGNTNVKFTRTSTEDSDKFDNYYGDGKVVVKNRLTLDTDTIQLINTYVYIQDDEINASSPTGTAQSAVTTTGEVHVYGGSQNIKFDSWSSWIHDDISWDPTSQTMTMTTDRDENDEERYGEIKFHHVDCDDYVISAKVHQDFIITIPAFDYFVIKFTWTEGDASVAVEFAGNSLSGDGSNNSTYDKKPVGWGYIPTPEEGNIQEGNWVKYKGEKLLEWGGYARGSEGETAFFNAPLLEGDTDSPRKINMDIYAAWEYGISLPKNKVLTVQFTAYKGGTMVKKGTNFLNQSGTLLYQEEYKTFVPKSGLSQNYDKGGYTKIAHLTYDRIKHSASIKILSEPS